MLILPEDMDDLTPSAPNKIFEDLRQINSSKQEYWSARQLARTLGYSEYRHFLPVIDKAKEACSQSGQVISDHFEDILEMIELGKSASRKIRDIQLDRFACYLIMQNADPSKKIVAMGQTYFAYQTRRQELSDELSDREKRVYIRGEVSKENKKLADTAKKSGVTRFGLFNDAGYKGLYGKPLAEVKQVKGIGQKEALLDRAGSTELAANLFRITQAEEKLRKDNIQGERDATQTHFMVGGKIRQTIKSIGGVLPENLPAERHIRELERELKKVGAIEQKSIPVGDQQMVDSENLTIRLPKGSTALTLQSLNRLLRGSPGTLPVILQISQTEPIRELRLPYTVELTEQLESEITELLDNPASIYPEDDDLPF